MDWPRLVESLYNSGPGAIIAALLLIGIYRLADKHLGAFIQAAKDQAASVAKLAQGTDGLKDCITAFVNKDNQDHREMTILLKVIMEKLDNLEESRGRSE